VNGGAEQTAKDAAALAVFSRKGLFASLFFGGVLLLCWLSPSPNTLPAAGVEASLPDQVGGMKGGERQGMTPPEKALLPADTEIVRRIYTNDRGDALACTIVLAGGAKNSIHRPEACLPAQGWTIENETVVPVDLANGHTLKVMKVSARRANPRAAGPPNALFLYWFVGKNTATPSHWTRVFLGSWDRIFHNVNHRWAYVSVFMPVANSRHAEDTLAIMRDFIAKSAPRYMKAEMTAPAPTAAGR
jgi:EpsI family protein